MAFVNRLVERIVDPLSSMPTSGNPRDLVIWDNRVLLHAATLYDMDGDHRLIYRTTTKGERPDHAGQPGREQRRGMTATCGFGRDGSEAVGTLVGQAGSGRSGAAPRERSWYVSMGMKVSSAMTEAPCRATE